MDTSTLAPATFQRPPAAGDNRPHAVVIGAGFGGLAAAIRLGAKGYRVTVLEKLDAPGGRAYTYHQDGFTFDAGPTIITAPYMFEELWTLCGQRMADDVELRPDRSVLPHPLRRRHGTSPTPPTTTRCAPRSRGSRPSDVAGFDRFMREQRGHLQGRLRGTGRQALPQHGVHAASAAAELVRLQGYRTVYSRVSDYFTQREAAHRLQLPPAADRRQSVDHHRLLLPDRASRAHARRALRDGRHGRAGAAAWSG